MKLIKTYHSDLLNGDGLREVLFFSGCMNKCPGCFNPETWDPDMPAAKEWTEQDWENLKSELEKPWITGVTLTGGDPFSIWNRDDILELCKRIKTEIPGKDIWVYTGYLWETILKDNDSRKKCLEYIDILCEGPYREAERSPKKLWVGSENQRVIDVQKSLETGEIVLHCD